MRRQQVDLGMGLRNAYANLKSSSFFKSNSNQFHQREHSTLSRSHLWKMYGVSGTTPKGIFGNPLLAAGRFYSNALWKGRSNVPAAIRNARFYNSFNSLDSGRRASFKWFTTDGVVIGLIATNVAVFLLWKVADNDFMVKNFMISVDNIKSGRVHTLITSAFTHHDTFHFATNMLGLYFFGKSIGQCLGHQKLLKLYLTGALVGSVLYLGYHSLIVPKLPSDPYGKAPAQGASGAIAALVELGVFLYPLSFVKRVDFVIPGPALLLGIFIIAKDMERLSEGNIGFALLGGSTVALLAWFSLAYM